MAATTETKGKGKSKKQNGNKTPSPPPDSEALQKTETTALVNPADFEFDGLEEVGEGDLIMPRRVIVQPTSRMEDATPGRFRDNLLGDEAELMQITPLLVRRGQVLFPKADFTGQTLCRSSDGWKPDPSVEEPKNDRCAIQDGRRRVYVCPYGMFGNQEGAVDADGEPAGKGNPPACSMTWNLICIDHATELPFFIGFSGTSIKPVRHFLTAIKLRRQPLFGIKAVMGLDKMTNKRGTFFVVNFKDIQAHPEGKTIEYYKLAGQFRSYDFGKTEAAEKAKESNNTDFDPSTF